MRRSRGNWLVCICDDYIGAAKLHNQCRSHGVQAGTIDALLARICIRHDLVMLSTDRDFSHFADWTPLNLWRARQKRPTQPIATGEEIWLPASLRYCP